MTATIGGGTIGGAGGGAVGPDFSLDYRRDQVIADLVVSGATPVLYWQFSTASSIFGAPVGPLRAGEYLAHGTLITSLTASSTSLSVSFSVNGVPSPLPGPFLQTNVINGVHWFAGTLVIPVAAGDQTIELYIAKASGSGDVVGRAAIIAWDRKL